jgi:hypothetical protein
LEGVIQGFKTLDAENALRVERATQYHSRLLNSELSLASSWKESGVVWRYSFLVNDPEKLLVVTDTLRKNRIHASNHYWSVADLFYGEKDYPHTSYVCPRILNLWVDANATKDYIAATCDIIMASLG